MVVVDSPLKEEVIGSKHEAQDTQSPPHHQHPTSIPREGLRGVLQWDQLLSDYCAQDAKNAGPGNQLLSEIC